MYTSLVLHGVTEIKWGREMKLTGQNYTRELIFQSPQGEVRVELYSTKPISISEGPSQDGIREQVHNVD